jgi:hypothetical protein
MRRRRRATAAVAAANYGAAFVFMHGHRVQGEGDPDYLSARTSASGLEPHADDSDRRRDPVPLDKSDWKAGDHKIAYQSCDDATAQAASGIRASARRTRTLCRERQGHRRIGTFNSGCAAIEIPV